MKIVRVLVVACLSLPLLLQADEGRFEVSQGMLPLTITVPGSYILTGNLSGAGIGDAITINTNQVTLDLNGFQMNGTGGSGDAIALGAVKHVTIQNGAIRNWALSGIDGDTSEHSVYQNLTVSGNIRHGVHAGSFCRVIDVTSDRNGDDGINAGDGSLIRHSLSSNNGTDASGSGIVVDESCVVLECLTFDNATYEILAGSRNRIDGNLCDCNGTPIGPNPLPEDTGIQVDNDANLIRDNHVTGCVDAYKIAGAGDFNIVVANTAAESTDDFDIPNGNTVGEETTDIASTNNVNTGHGFMNVTQ